MCLSLWPWFYVWGTAVSIRQFQSTLQLGGNRGNFPEGPRSSLPWYDNRVLPGRGHRCKRGENPPNAIAWDQFLAQNEWWCDGSWFWQSYLRYLYTVYIWAYSLSRGYCEDRWQLLEDPQEDWRHAWRFQRPQPRQFLFWKKKTVLIPDFLPWSCKTCPDANLEPCQCYQSTNNRNQKCPTFHFAQIKCSSTKELTLWYRLPKVSPFECRCSELLSNVQKGHETWW